MLQQQETKMKLLYLVILLLAFCSCSEQNKPNIDGILQVGEQVNYKLSNGELITISLKEDGFDFLYLGELREFSFSKSKNQIKTLADFKGNEPYSIADTDGDFMPDYKIKEGKRMKLKISDE